MRLSLGDLRMHAIAATLFKPTTLRQAIERLGFVQVDPIRSPAPAQDLILRHRVNGYRAGDMERNYPRLDIEEDRLYAHGFMPRSTSHLLHPRRGRRLTAIERQVLAFAVAKKRIHPDDLEIHLGRKMVVNGWGGQSRETTRALHSLHFRGMLRVAGREGGTRTYEPTEKLEQFDPGERSRQLVIAVASVLAPLSEKSLTTTLGYVAYGTPALKGLRSLVPQLIDSGDLSAVLIDGIRYLWPSKRPLRHTTNASVRFLAPFDPLVWDRQRFEHLWGWQYRFEAYVPAAKRQFGYYAMPMLWRDDMIGWVNLSISNRKLVVERGFKKALPKERAFETEFEAELARFEVFLGKRLEHPSP